MCINHTRSSVDASAGGLNYLLRTRDEGLGSCLWKWFISQSRVQSKGSHMAQRWNSCLSRRNNSAASTIWVNYETCNFHAHVAATHQHSCHGVGDGERWTIPVLCALCPGPLHGHSSPETLTQRPPPCRAACPGAACPGPASEVIWADALSAPLVSLPYPRRVGFPVPPENIRVIPLTVATACLFGRVGQI